MSEAIKHFDYGTEERKKLDLMASMLTFLSPNRRQYYVGDTYFDYGQNWIWTTILADSCPAQGSYQALYPKQQEDVLLADSVEEIADLARAYLADDTYRRLLK